jgi:hypothetical protein
MATSSNPVIQQLMNDVDSIDPNSPDIEATLQKLAEAVAAEQSKNRAGTTDFAPIDPQDAFQCEGCQ